MATLYAVISNIPAQFHSQDLRNYFSQFVEERGFVCFHFKHRPEIKLNPGPDADKFQVGGSDKSDKKGKSIIKPNSLCCVVKITNKNLEKLVKMYHGKQWVEKDGSFLSKKCKISRIKVASESLEGEQYKTRSEVKAIPADREQFTKRDLEGLPELNPPDIMPNGNVGTPTKVFQQYIRDCKMPPYLIKRLGLVFPKSRSNRRYGNVPFDYGGDVLSGYQSEEDSVVTARGAEIFEASSSELSESEKGAKQSYDKETCPDSPEQPPSDSASDDDDDVNPEEWERYEALFDDPANKERNKERLYEEEIELKWEKGGSGLVFYTDANYWDDQQGDFEERTADDWDVDMSVYYDPDAGDKDARDFVQMRLEERRRAGLEDTGMEKSKIGTFERHTKGFGRKVLTRQGWQEGEGLGSSVRGIPEALEGEGQNPKDKRGLGYYGEKLNRNPLKKKISIISSVYDDPDDIEESDSLLRRTGHLNTKFRKKQHQDKN